MLGKLGLRDRVQAVVLAYESGLITPGRASGLTRHLRPISRSSGGYTTRWRNGLIAAM